MRSWVVPLAPVARVVKMSGCRDLQAFNDLLCHSLDVVPLIFTFHVAHWHVHLRFGSEIALRL